MKCKVCGAESGKYPLCRACNIKKEKGEIIKCEKCGNWHNINTPCPELNTATNSDDYLYTVRKSLIRKSEQEFYNVIKDSIPNNYSVFPQINLASFIERTDNSKFRNELFRNVDFLITDSDYAPKFIIEINDQTHLTSDRKKRDEKVQKICEEAGIPILKLWTSYGVNPKYIRIRIDEMLNKLPVARVHHFDQTSIQQRQSVDAHDFDQSSTQQHQTAATSPQPPTKKKKGCYVATCIYGSYDCPEVWALRRYRDTTLSSNRWGKAFIKIYYALSPTLVKHFGKYNWFICACKPILDKFVSKLQMSGFENTPYQDSDELDSFYSAR